MELELGGQRSQRVVEVAFKPTTGDSTLDLRFRYNKATSPETMQGLQDLGDAIEIREVNQTDVVMHLQTDRSDLQDSIGREEFIFDGQSSRAAYGDREVNVELRGYAGSDEIEIHEITIAGAE